MDHAGPVAILTDDPDLQLRRAQTSDDEFACALFAATRRAQFEAGGLHGPMLDRLLNQQFRMQTAGYRQQFPGSVVYIAEWRCRAVGRMWLHCRSDAWHIVDIALLPEHCGRGTGTAIIGAIETAARSQGASALTLTVLAENIRARRLYQRLGFGEAAADGVYINAIKRLADRPVSHVVCPSPDC